MICPTLWTVERVITLYSYCDLEILLEKDCFQLIGLEMIDRSEDNWKIIIG